METVKEGLDEFLIALQQGHANIVGTPTPPRMGEQQVFGLLLDLEVKPRSISVQITAMAGAANPVMRQPAFLIGDAHHILEAQCYPRFSVRFELCQTDDYVCLQNTVGYAVQISLQIVGLNSRLLIYRSSAPISWGMLRNLS